MDDLIKFDPSCILERIRKKMAESTQSMGGIVEYIGTKYPHDAELRQMLLHYLEQDNEVTKLMMTYVSIEQMNNQFLMDRMIDYGKELEELSSDINNDDDQ